MLSGDEIMKEKKTHNIDMLNGSLLKKILIFSLPLAASSILQQLFNSIDVAVVGKFATSQDQAAVGCSSALINLIINLFVGVSVGANVVIANFIGQKEYKKVKDAVHTSIIIALISGIFLMVLGILIARPVLSLMGTPDDTIDLAVLYLRIYFIGMPFIMLYNFGSAILRSIGDTKRPMFSLIIAGVINAALNMLFVIVFKMGVAGVGIATVISNVVSSSIIIYLLLHEDEPVRLSPGELKITKPELMKMLRIGIPSGLQGMVFSFANVYIQSAINGFGSDAVAGSSIALNFEYFSYFMVSAFDQAVVTFVSQNYGAGKIDRCKKTFYVAMACSVAITFVMTMAFSQGRYLFVSLFTSNPEVAEYAAIRMQRVLTIYIILNSYEISGSALRGLGYSMTPALLTVFGTCVLRLAWIYTVFAKVHTYEMLLNVYPVSWVITGTMVVIAYFKISRKVYGRNLR